MSEECSSYSTSTSCSYDCGEATLYCPMYYGEEGESCRSDSRISWQHFPRSTSSRSHCDDSTMKSIPGPSLPEISFKQEDEREKKESSVASSTVYPITKSIAQLKAEHYLNIRHVHAFFNFLIGHLICAEPDDPIEYLKEILERCLNFRDHGEEEPLLVSEYHIKSLYDSFDPYGNGSISVDQYEVAMNSIGLSKGITQPNQNPPLNESGKVDREFFHSEALRCFKQNLRSMLRIPKKWEENRLVWKAVMKKRHPKVMPYKSDEEQLGQNSPKSSSASEREVCILSPRPPKLKHEPEQLFLTG